MKASPFRVVALTLALTLGTGPMARACAGDGAASRTPRHVVQDGDEVAAQEDLLTLAELLVLGLALLGEPSGAANPCSGCTGGASHK